MAKLPLSLKGKRKKAITRTETVVEGFLRQLGLSVEEAAPVNHLEGSQGISLSFDTLISASATYWPSSTRSQGTRPCQSASPGTGQRGEGYV